jgi:selenocysteine lyase/cysteine desulfurase
LTDYLIAGLKKLPVKIVSPIKNEKERSAIIVFSTTADNRKIVSDLEVKGIYTSLRDGNIRVSVNIFNNPEEINRLLSEWAGMLI